MVGIIESALSTRGMRPGQPGMGLGRPHHDLKHDATDLRRRIHGCQLLIRLCQVETLRESRTEISKGSVEESTVGFGSSCSCVIIMGFVIGIIGGALTLSRKRTIPNIEPATGGDRGAWGSVNPSDKAPGLSSRKTTQLNRKNTCLDMCECGPGEI